MLQRQEEEEEERRLKARSKRRVSVMTSLSMSAAMVCTHLMCHLESLFEGIAALPHET